MKPFDVIFREHFERSEKSIVEVAKMLDVSIDTVKGWLEKGCTEPPKTVRVGVLKILFDVVCQKRHLAKQKAKKPVKWLVVTPNNQKLKLQSLRGYILKNINKDLKYYMAVVTDINKDGVSMVEGYTFKKIDRE